jgi:hypothetical protein
MNKLTPQQARALRRRHKHERQAVIFGSLIAALALAGLGATAIYTGAMNAPFLARDFTTPAPDIAAEVVPDPPCPPEGAVSVANASVQIHVLNSTDTAGLATTTAAELTANGFTVLDTGNYPALLRQPARIQFGVSGLAAAFTVAATIEGSTLILDTRQDASVDVVIGEDWPGLTPAAEVTLAFAAPLEGAANCVPLEQAIEDAVPGPTVAPAETPAAPAG